MEISKIQEMEAILNDPTVQLMKNIRDNHENLKAAALTMIQSMAHVWDSNTGTWCAWCEQNLTQEEKDYLVATYNGIMAMMETSR